MRLKSVCIIRETVAGKYLSWLTIGLILGLAHTLWRVDVLDCDAPRTWQSMIYVCPIHSWRSIGRFQQGSPTVSGAERCPAARRCAAVRQTCMTG